MTLEESIQQKQPFRNEYHKLIVNLMFTYHTLVPHLRQSVESFGISLQQYNILRILRGQFPNPICVYALQERMLEKSSDVSRLVDRLEAKQLAQRVLCEEDRRRRHVVITNAGLELLQQLDDRVEDWDERFTTLSPLEAQLLNSLLDKLRG